MAFRAITALEPGQSFWRLTIAFEIDAKAPRHDIETENYSARGPSVFHVAGFTEVFFKSLVVSYIVALGE
jgi:hypothetical protein